MIIRDGTVSLAAGQIIHSGAALPNVTVSVGLSLYRNGEELEALMKNADEALYAAKDAGRNRTIVSGFTATPKKKAS